MGYNFIHFYSFAPWCPACKQFSSTWTQLAATSGLKTNIAAIDVTESPSLSFIFFVRQLPTLFHAKDGVFRLYDGSRNLGDLQNYLTEKKYDNTEPLPWYYTPSSVHMRFFFQFMELGMAVTHIHQYLLDNGYPTWMSFVIIGSGTIMLGLLLGTVLVILFDCFVPPRPQILRLFSTQKKDQRQSAKRLADDIKNSPAQSPVSVNKLPVDGSGEREEDRQENEVRKRPSDSEN
ncbi:hypothetical protein P879_10447 [Paragonimus westermani]|uniref:Thioredoxin domain-containing protein n=1 Tax=Paragonimus westermani TaxID=34504 RepID=A0A8T0DK90_9TREM|nr:hypothetical protein P879_10447 [Paragonimus westermani]